MNSDLILTDIEYLDPPVSTGSNTQVVANCTLAVSDLLKIEGCAIVRTPTRVALWAPACTQRPGQGRKAIRFGPAMVERVNEIARLACQRRRTA